MKWSELYKSMIIGLILTIVIVGLGLYLSNLYLLISWEFTVITIIVMLIAVAISSIFVSIFSKTKQEIELKSVVNGLHKIVSSMEKREDLTKSGLLLSNEDFLYEEAKQKNVWIVVEDFDPTGGSIWTENIEKNILAGAKYVVFLSSQKIASALGFVTKLTKKDYKKIPHRVEVNNGSIEFNCISPQAFLFVTNITIWNPYPKENEVRRAFIDIPSKQIDYQIEIGDIETTSLIQKLEDIRNKKPMRRLR